MYLYVLIHLFRLPDVRENSAATNGMKGCCLVKGPAVHWTHRWNWSPEFSVLNFGRAYMLSDKPFFSLLRNFDPNGCIIGAGTNVPWFVPVFWLYSEVELVIMKNAEQSYTVDYWVVWFSRLTGFGSYFNVDKCYSNLTVFCLQYLSVFQNRRVNIILVKKLTDLKLSNLSTVI